MDNELNIEEIENAKEESNENFADSNVNEDVDNISDVDTETFDGEEASGTDASDPGTTESTEPGVENETDDNIPGETDNADNEVSNEPSGDDTGDDAVQFNAEVESTDDDANKKNRKEFSVNGMTFEVSLSDIQNAISELVNNTYAEADNDYYSVEIYEGSKSVVMIGIYSCKSYKQGYKVRNGLYSLVGDRIPVKAIFVTADEEAELDKMRSNYSVVSEKLEKYESEPEKMNILNSPDYMSLAGKADFEEFKKPENHFDMSIEDVKNKADAILLEYAKSGRLNFSASDNAKSNEVKNDFFMFSTGISNTSFLDSLLNKR